MNRSLWALRTACWEVARKEQEGKQRLHRQVGAFLEGLGNIIADIENDRIPHNPVALEKALTDSLECNIYNNQKA